MATKNAVIIAEKGGELTTLPIPQRKKVAKIARENHLTQAQQQDVAYIIATHQAMPHYVGKLLTEGFTVEAIADAYNIRRELSISIDATRQTAPSLKKILQFRAFVNEDCLSDDDLASLLDTVIRLMYKRLKKSSKFFDVCIGRALEIAQKQGIHDPYILLEYLDSEEDVLTEAWDFFNASEKQ